MHACFAIPEIVQRIAEEAGRGSETFPDDESEVDTLTVYALARTCRAFLEPALDVLWSCQWDLGFLIVCMPKDLWEWKAEAAGQYSLVSHTFCFNILTYVD